MPRVIDLSQLPVELLDETTAHLTLRSLLNLSLVSRLFHSIASRHLYQMIRLESHGQIAKCCRTLSARPQIAQSVRELNIKMYVSPKTSHCVCLMS